MPHFDNVTVLKNANIYFNGNVTSRVILFPDGSKKTLGIILPGEYEFDTSDRERMDIQAGELEVLLPDQTDWQTIQAGESFDIPANSIFKIKVKSITDYCCSYFGA